MSTRIIVPGRGWAYTGVVLGGAVSIAANITHTFVPPVGHPAGWTPAPMAVAFATSWPVFLFVAIEILARTPWPRMWNWTLLRWAGLTPVALVAAFVSYRHLSGLLAHYGEEPLAAWTGPLAVDGLMVVATGALLATSRRHTASTSVSDLTARHVAVPGPPIQPSIAQLSTVDNAVPAPADPATSNQPPVSPVDTQPANPTPAPKPAEEPVRPKSVPTPAQLADRITPPRTATDSATPVATSRSGASTTRRSRPGSPATPAPTLAPSTTDTHVSASDAAQLTLPIVSPDLLARAAQVARQHRTEAGTPITPGQLAARLKVNSDQAVQALAVLDLGPDSPTTPVPTVNGNRPKGNHPKATR